MSAGSEKSRKSKGNVVQSKESWARKEWQSAVGSSKWLVAIFDVDRSEVRLD